MIRQIGKYRLLRKLGEGGMAEVYLAKDILTERIFAMKILYPHLAERRIVRQRFIREARLMLDLQHPGIIKCFDIDQVGGYYYILMEYIEGTSLAEIISKHTGPIPYRKALTLFRQILNAVAYAHKKGVIHRDLKPRNILIQGFSSVLTGRETIKVGDFGIAKILGQDGNTATGTRIGTLYYMSPEQISDQDAVDQRSDIYSLGMTLYHMLSGQIPFSETSSDFSIMETIVNGIIESPKKHYPEIPDWLVGIVKKALAKEKADRYQCCEEFLIAIKTAPHGKKVQGDSTTSSKKATKAEPTLISELTEPVIQLTADRPDIGTLVKENPDREIASLSSSFSDRAKINWKKFVKNGTILTGAISFLVLLFLLIIMLKVAALNSVKLPSSSLSNPSSTVESNETMVLRDAFEADLKARRHIWPTKNNAYKKLLRLQELSTDSIWLRNQKQNLSKRLFEDGIREFNIGRVNQAVELLEKAKLLDKRNSEINIKLNAFRRQLGLNSAVRTDSATNISEKADAILMAEEELRFVEIPGGTFTMGDFFKEGEDDEQPIHTVNLDNFFLSATEVTISQFEKFVEATGYKTDAEKEGGAYSFNGKPVFMMGLSWRNPGFHQGKKSLPVVCVSWNDARAFCDWRGVRLPTEAEWEYAARECGKAIKFSWGSDPPTLLKGGNILDESAGLHFSVQPAWAGYKDGYINTAPVAQFGANALGLYDMTGNVSEWCADYYQAGYYSASGEKNPNGALSGDRHVYRGGSWCEQKKNLRIAKRNAGDPSERYSDLGFRVAKSRNS